MDLTAQLYAAVHRGTPGDRAFYVDVCRGAGSVLELGCGSGRMLDALAAPGRRLVGVDLDPRQLALVTADAELVCGDMREVELGARFDRVLIPFNGLWCLPGEAAMGQALRNAARHLAPGGILALDVYRVDEFHADSAPGDWSEDALQPITEVQCAGQRWTVHERSRWDRDGQTIEAEYVHRPERGEPVTITIVHHYVLRPTLLRLLAEAGLRPLQVRHGLAGDDSLLIRAGPS